MSRLARGKPLPKGCQPKQMPDWWPEIGYYRWATYRMHTFPILILVHFNHPPIMWTQNKAGEWAFMRELKV